MINEEGHECLGPFEDGSTIDLVADLTEGSGSILGKEWRRSYKFG